VSINLPSLPVTQTLPELRQALGSHSNVVLQAPPGAGKSTLVPLALLEAPWLGSSKVVMLEPRRLAARAVASRMAQLLNEPVGRTVGYRTRLDTKVSAATRIEVVTEGILTRWLQRDPALEGVALLIFDEFHERSLHADLGLALSLDAQGALREDLKILVMSATLDGAAVARLLGNAPIVTSVGKAFDVETRYREKPPGRGPARTQEDDIARVAATVIQRALDDEHGDVLAFFPGQGEIRRTQRFLEEAQLPQGTRVFPLYGELPAEQQDAAIRPSAHGERKVVLATNIAETSLTIEGVRVVVDSGLARRSRFDPATGMSRLEVVRISRASADQRRGRAGRLEAGVCYRLWSEAEQSSLIAHTPAEIVEADLAPLALELASWGISDPQALRWLDAPPAATFSQARDLLMELDALDDNGRINSHGRALARIGAHPRLAHMIIRGRELGLARLALQIAALLGERDLLRMGPTSRDVDLRLRLDALGTARRSGNRGLPAGVTVDTAARQRVLRSIEVLQRQLDFDDRSDATYTDDDAGRLLALAYPDRIAQARGEGGRYLLSGGRGARLVDAQNLSKAEFLVIADLDAGEREATIRMAAPIDRQSLENEFSTHIHSRERIEWSSREQVVIAQRERWLGAINLEARRLENPDSTQLAAALMMGIRELGIASLPWDRESRSLQARLMFARANDDRAAKPWPAVGDPDLLVSLETWLAPWLNGMTRRDHWARLNLHSALLALLDWDQQQRLNEIAPTHLAVPSGSRIPIDYSNVPTVSVRLQEVFGLQQTPMVGGGKVPITLQLLSPAQRPVQVTRDLTSFWARGYAEVKKELKGRYPKHYWPDDPLTAEATARVRRK